MRPVLGAGTARIFFSDFYEKKNAAPANTGALPGAMSIEKAGTRSEN